MMPAMAFEKRSILDHQRRIGFWSLSSVTSFSIFSVHDFKWSIWTSQKLVSERDIWVFHDRRFCQIIWQILTLRGAKKKSSQNCPQWVLKPRPPDHQANALPTELSQHSVAILDLHGLYKVIALLILEMNKVQHVKWCMKQSSLQKSPAQQIPA